MLDHGVHDSFHLVIDISIMLLEVIFHIVDLSSRCILNIIGSEILHHLRVSLDIFDSGVGNDRRNSVEGMVAFHFFEDLFHVAFGGRTHIVEQNFLRIGLVILGELHSVLVDEFFEVGSVVYHIIYGIQVICVHLAEPAEEEVSDGGSVRLDIVQNSVNDIFFKSRILAGVAIESRNNLFKVGSVNFLEVFHDLLGGEGIVAVSGEKGVGDGIDVHGVMQTVVIDIHDNFGALPVDAGKRSVV